MLCSNVLKFAGKNQKLSLNLIRNMSATSDKTVITEEVGDKGIITLNRPKALNAINLDMVRTIYSTLEAWECQKLLVIIQGAGKAFYSGGDVRHIYENLETMGDSVDPDYCKKLFRQVYQMNGLIGSYKSPYLALIDGITMGGGVGVSVHGKYRIATERTVFAMPETAVGLFPDVGASYFLSRMPGKLGLFLGMTGFRLKGQDVLHIGIATHFTESDNLPELEKELLLNTNSVHCIDTVLKKLCVAPSHEFSLATNMDQINNCFQLILYKKSSKI